jgi:hypothetical protein
MMQRSAGYYSLAAVWLLSAAPLLAQQTFNRHQVVLDSQGKLLSWVQS